MTKLQKKPAGLFDSLIPAVHQTAFWKAFDQKKIFCLTQPTPSINVFKKISFLKSLTSLEDHWSLEVDVHLADSRDEHTTKTYNSSHTAFEEFKNGQSLLFNDVNRLAPELDSWLESLRSSLKFSSHTYSRCLVYATPAGGGNAAHFDQNYNFILQLTGQKIWWTAPNTSVINPTGRHVIGQETDPGLEVYTTEPMPKVFPDADSEEFQLSAGSLLYVPPGVWHKTKASSDAISLNFTFSVPSFADLFLTAVRSRILSSEIWRETALDLKNLDQKDKLQFLIEHLADDIKHWSAEDILSLLGEEKI